MMPMSSFEYYEDMRDTELSRHGALSWLSASTRVASLIRLPTPTFTPS